MQMLWVEHVKAMSAAAEALDKFVVALETLPGDRELSYDVTVDFNLYGEPLGWSLVAEDGTSYWKIKEVGDDE